MTSKRAVQLGVSEGRDQDRAGVGIHPSSSLQLGPTSANLLKRRPLMSVLDSPWSTNSLTTLPVAAAMANP